ncbi:hypothetical protein BH708_06085 [Brachybacterium sp. P6-10-X1]|uniref:GvpL/GvpF family gas vesicle protein n=1 Tax=Brachybacterium sp. P6-10-X1 TaxID=1903186 RepID=UPI000971B922|nr:GvpL/GvpF family gas vesicle protein [Brachybacterium sp. P6-10-X1]APX32361.1 hypothetical protein BH708_06085 [Brachybacterium sp. P6-10-X1]
MEPTELRTQDEAAPGDGLYVYGIGRADASLPEGLVGVLAGRPRLQRRGDLAAVVSELPEDADFGTPQDLVAHSAVLDAIAESVAVLPMRFGTVVPSADDLDRELLAEPDDLVAALDGVDGAVQYTVRVRYDQDVVLPEIIRSDPRLAGLQEAIAGTTEDETRTQRIELGEGIVSHFDALRGPDAEALLEMLDPLVRDRSVHETSQAGDVVDVALLVARADQEDVEAAIEDAAERDHPRLRYRLLGPQAPYDFVGGGR